MNIARTQHTATALQDGRVLVVAGALNSPLSAEVYDPVTDVWTATPNMVSAREGNHTATRLPNGRVLVAGGGRGLTYLAAAEIYDPMAGTWTATGNMSRFRIGHSATLLNNGFVLVAGGSEGTYPYAGVASAELYNPATGTWAATGSMTYPRCCHTAALLASGQVLVAAGSHLTNQIRTAELYDPVLSAAGTRH
jgi:hypothetical protein